MWPAGSSPSRPLAHATTAEAAVYVLVPGTGAVAAAVNRSPGRDLSAALLVCDRAPVALREPVRARLWLSGWLAPVPAGQLRAAALAVAAVRPAGDLLDVGRGSALLRLDLAEAVLREGDRCTEVDPGDYAAARPDPLAGVAARMLQHLDRDHPEVLAALCGALPAGARRAGDVVRPLGIDRFGHRLRVERPAGHRDLRLPFRRPLTCPGQLRAATRHLLDTARR